MESYWAVELNTNDFTFLYHLTTLPILPKLHSTLLIINNKSKSREQQLIAYNNVECTVIIDSYYIHTNFFVLSVAAILDNNYHCVPSWSKQQHVTYALKDGILAKNVFIKKPILFPEPLIATGIIKKLNKYIPDNHIWFYNHKQPYGFMSNFYNIKVTINNITYHHIEGYFQSQKSVGVDNNYTNLVLSQTSPNKSATMGRKGPLRANWSMIKDNVMRRAVFHKFSLSNLKKLLLDTQNNYLVEHTTRDNYWGDGSNQKGLNMLGKILEETRYLLGGMLSDRYKNMLVFDYSHWIIPGLFLASGAPNNDCYQVLKDVGFQHFISLMEPYQEQEYQTMYHGNTTNSNFDTTADNIRLTRVSIVDRKVTDDQTAIQIAKMILHSISCKIPVVLHCFGGKGRTCTIAALVIGLLYQLDGQTSLEVIKQLFEHRPNKGQKRPQMPQTKVQFDQVKRILKNGNNYYKDFD
jgi:N-glycosidase YbiA